MFNTSTFNSMSFNGIGDLTLSVLGIKPVTKWSGNPSAEADEYTYDSATDVYDSSSRNYDGVVGGDLADNEKTPTEWSEQ
jgi:hypothetical protein